MLWRLYSTGCGYGIEDGPDGATRQHSFVSCGRHCTVDVLPLNRTALLTHWRITDLDYYAMPVGYCQLWAAGRTVTLPSVSYWDVMRCLPGS